MPELADETVLKAVVRKGVWVRIPPERPICWDVFQLAGRRTLNPLIVVRVHAPQPNSYPLLVELADTRDSKPRALKSVKVQVLRGGPMDCYVNGRLLAF